MIEELTLDDVKEIFEEEKPMPSYLSFIKGPTQVHRSTMEVACIMLDINRSNFKNCYLAMEKKENHETLIAKMKEFNKDKISAENLTKVDKILK